MDQLDPSLRSEGFLSLKNSMSWLYVFSPCHNPSAHSPTTALKNIYASCYTRSPLQPDAPTSTGANETSRCAHIVLCTSTPHVPSPAHFVLLPLSSPLLPACKGLIQHVNVLQRHILPAPVLAVGNIKHSGDCWYFIIYEALVISYINNP